MSWLNPLYLSWGLCGFYVLMSILWGLKANWPQAIYWFGAAVLTVGVTKMA